MLLLIRILGGAVVVAWWTAAAAIYLRPVAGLRIYRWLFHELKPAYLPAAAVCYLIDGQVLLLAISVVNYFLWRNTDDDDRWKRRRRNAAEKVAAIGGRLTVVPAESGGRA